MTEAIRSWSSVILTTVAALPVATLIVIGLATSRARAGVPPRRAWLTAAADVGIVVGTLPWIWMTLTPRAGPGRLELIPGRGLAELLGGDHSVAIVQVGGNLLVFAAFGLLAPIRWRLGALAIAGYAAVGSTVVESLQFVLQLGRVSSVDDVALNTLGAVLAGFSSWRWWHRHGDAQPAVQ